MTFNLLLQNGDLLLLENGNGILTEDYVPIIYDLAPDILVGAVVVTSPITNTPGRFILPKRDLIWVSDYAGERVNVLD